MVSVSKKSPPMLREVSFQSVLRFERDYDEFSAVGGKLKAKRLITQDVRTFLEATTTLTGPVEGLADAVGKRAKRRLANEHLFRCLYDAVRPEGAEERLALLRLPCDRITPGAVAVHLQKFKARLELAKPPQDDRVLAQAYAACFRSEPFAEALRHYAEGRELSKLFAFAVSHARAVEAALAVATPYVTTSSREKSTRAPGVVPSAAPVPAIVKRGRDRKQRESKERQRPERPVPPPRYQETSTDARSKPRPQRSERLEQPCYNCGRPGHRSTNCDRPKVKCHECGKEGHLKRFCRNNKPSEYPVSAFASVTTPEEGNSEELNCSATVVSGKAMPPFLKVATTTGVVSGVGSKDILLDSGADSVFVSPALVERAKLTARVVPGRTVRTANGKAEVKTCVPLEIVLDASPYAPKGCTFATVAFVLKTEFDLILGTPIMVQLGVLPQLDKTERSGDDVDDASELPEPRLPERAAYMLSSAGQDRQARLLERFASAFERTAEFSQLTPYDLVLTKEKVVSARPYYIPPPKQAMIRTHLDELLEKGFIEPSTSPYSSPALVVPKGKTKTRFVVDYRKVNELTDPFDFPIPKIDECLQYLSGKKVFATLDLSAGYHQVRLTERSKQYTAFATVSGRYQYRGMPFGLKNAGAHFQLAMERAFADLLFDACIIYVDDIIVMGKTEDEYLANLEKVLRRAVKLDLTLNREKSTFNAAEVEFLGWVVSGDGYHISPERVQDVADLKLPNTRKKAQALMGFLNYMRDFVPHFAQVTRPIALVAAGKAEPGGEEQQAALDAVKQALTSAESLALFDADAEHVVMTDAASVGYGAVLLQNGRPMCYLSHAFNDVQSRWCTTEQEAYAIVAAFKQWRKLLVWTEFTLLTDHRNLLFMARSSNAKVQRWFESLADLRFTVKHVPGVNNGAADGLSRVYATQTEGAGASGVADEHIRNVHCEGHAHLSVNHTHNLLRERGHKVPVEQVARALKRCPVCQLLARPIIGPNIGLHTAVDKVLQRVAVDLIGPLPRCDGMAYTLVMTDMCSRWTELTPLATKSAQEVVPTIVNTWFMRFGVPHVLQSDGGGEFVNALMSDMAERVGFKVHVTTPHHPQSNGMVERQPERDADSQGSSLLFGPPGLG